FRQPQVGTDPAGKRLMLSVEAERPGQPATAGVEHLDLVTEGPQDHFVSGRTHHRALVAMRVQNGPAGLARANGRQAVEPAGANQVLGGAAGEGGEASGARVAR